jgi:hypothetical protein
LGWLRSIQPPHAPGYFGQQRMGTKMDKIVQQYMWKDEDGADYYMIIGLTADDLKALGFDVPQSKVTASGRRVRP